jgi:hypothetical protein
MRQAHTQRRRRRLFGQAAPQGSGVVRERPREHVSRPAFVAVGRGDVEEGDEHLV